MTDNIAKITKILLWVLIALSLFYAIMLFVNASADNPKWIVNSLTYTEVLLYIAVGAVVLFSLFNFILNLIARPKKALLSLIPIVILGVVFLIAYSYASDKVLYMPTYEGTDNVPGILKWSGAGLITAYIFFGLAILSILYAEIAKLFK
ncbi:MAG: hypothetical protein L3J56_07025 [Bacteroidales bacterium]|nr:hypothetical protein [Bacteroidales bacterium]NOZ35201.1 hypothetical protein [Chlorobiota bacterium]